jgi:hypothetical protein
LRRREEIVGLIAEQLGVTEISFPKGIIADNPTVTLCKIALTDLWLRCHGELTLQEKEVHFEKFCVALFGAAFEVVEVRQLATFGGIDIICEKKADSFWVRWPSDCFVECKNHRDRESVATANEFIGKGSAVSIRLAFLVNARPFTEPARERISRSRSQANVPDMAWIDGEDIKEWLSNNIDDERFLKKVFAFWTSIRYGAF